MASLTRHLADIPFITFIGFISIASVSTAVLAAAEDTPQLQFVQAQQANSAALREYTWKSRTELTLRGEVKNVKLEQVRHDLDGRLQKTRIGGTPDPSEERFDPRAPRVGPVQRIVTAKKKEEFRDLMRDLAALADSYAHLPLETLHAFARNAAISKDSLLLRVHGRGIVKAGDSMTVWIDPVSFMMRRVEIATSLEGEAVEIAVDYRSLPNGLTYQARSLLRYPHRQVALAVENFEFQHAGGTR